MPGHSRASRRESDEATISSRSDSDFLRTAPQTAPMGVPDIEGISGEDLGLGLRTAFRDESAPRGILKTGDKKRGGIRWRDENPEEGAYAERTKHFGFTEPSNAVANEPEYGSAELSVPEDTREHPWYNSQKSEMKRRTAENTRNRTRQLSNMVMDLPRGEANANTYAQDITDDDRLLSTPTVEDRSQAEIDEMLTQQESTRNRQAEALGVQSYDADDRAKVVQRAKGGKPGFFSRMMSSMGLGRVFGEARSGDRTFDAVPRRAPRQRPGGWFERLFGTARKR